MPDPNDLMEIFDTISYAKGSCICRMLHNYVGQEAFTAGLKIYLTRHASANATTDDLLAAMDEVIQSMDSSFYYKFTHESEQLTTA